MIKLTQKHALGLALPQYGLKDPEKGLGKLLFQVVLCVYGDVILQHIDGILTSKHTHTNHVNMRFLASKTDIMMKVTSFILQCGLYPLENNHTKNAFGPLTWLWCAVRADLDSCRWDPLHRPVNQTGPFKKTDKRICLSVRREALLLFQEVAAFLGLRKEKPRPWPVMPQTKVWNYLLVKNSTSERAIKGLPSPAADVGPCLVFLSKWSRFQKKRERCGGRDEAQALHKSCFLPTVIEMDFGMSFYFQQGHCLPFFPPSL